MNSNKEKKRKKKKTRKFLWWFVFFFIHIDCISRDKLSYEIDMIKDEPKICCESVFGQFLQQYYVVSVRNYIYLQNWRLYFAQQIANDFVQIKSPFVHCQLWGGFDSLNSPLPFFLSPLGINSDLNRIEASVILSIIYFSFCTHAIEHLYYYNAIEDL